jgi:DNA-binding LytR/AlgR family response regulator
MNALIVEDEKHSVEKLTRLLHELAPELRIEGVSDGVASTVKWLEQHPSPDIIFMDIELSDGISFEIFELTNIQSQVVFVTAYDDHAIRAIKQGALDYILKPVTRKELEGVMERIKGQLESKKIGSTANVKEAFDFLKDRTLQNKLPIHSIEGTEFIDIDQIVRLSSDSNYTIVILLSGRKITVSKTLKEFEIQLDKMGFFRPHNRHLINLKYVQKYRNKDGGEILMIDNSVIDIARNRKKRLFELLGI